MESPSSDQIRLIASPSVLIHKSTVLLQGVRTKFTIRSTNGCFTIMTDRDVICMLQFPLTEPQPYMFVACEPIAFRYPESVLSKKTDVAFTVAADRNATLVSAAAAFSKHLDELEWMVTINQRYKERLEEYMMLYGLRSSPTLRPAVSLRSDGPITAGRTSSAASP